ncbi:MAG: hypothetical protein P4L36_22425 [Holophaga sp.]|nr:hypothetical protein [Holophaga sp.]
MSLRCFAILAVLLAAVGCAPERVVFTDDEVPLAAPLEAELGGGPMGREQDDPPNRVVRLNYAEGAVSRQPAGLDDWAPATVNLPLGTGDSLWVAPGGKAELHAGATDLRLAPGTGLEVLRLDNRALQLGLPQGSMELRIVPGRDLDSVEVDTPAGAVLLNQPGSYRVDADPGGSTGQITVRSGQAEVTSAGVTVPVSPGTTLALAGGDQPSYDVGEARAPDAFDRWCAARERREDHSESAIYLGRDMTGYEDLDGQGQWTMDPTYGTAWAPRVAAGWTPYQNGRWVWSEPWGWTWVDDAPWGFATSHYGRWAHAGQGWLWVPHAEGMRQSRPVYAPALVAFVGGPGLRGASAGAGVAWFPLGPQEPYVPAYPASRAYVAALNAGSLPPGAVVNPAAGPRVNRNIPGAVTVVPQSVFLGARPVAGATLAVHGQILEQGAQIGSAPALTPRRESLLAALPGAPPASRPPASGWARPLQVRNHIPVATVPFDSRQQALAAGRGRPLAAPALTGLRRQDPDARAVPTRLATSPAPGGRLRPARPELLQRQPSNGNRPFQPPPQPRSGNQPQPRPGGPFQQRSGNLPQSRPGSPFQSRPGNPAQERPNLDRGFGPPRGAQDGPQRAPQDGQLRGPQDAQDGQQRGPVGRPNQMRGQRRLPPRRPNPGRAQGREGGGERRR